MKEYKIYYTESGTIYEYCKAWVEADSEEEAINKLKAGEFSDTEVIDTEYGDDFNITVIEEVEELNYDNQ